NCDPFVPTSWLFEPLGGAGEVGAAAFEADAEVTARKVDQDLPALRVRRGGHGDGARPGRRGLADAALPYAGRDLAGPVDARDLDVRPVREPRVRLEQRTDPGQVARIAGDDRMRVSKGDGRDGQALDLLAATDVHLAEILLD